MSGEEETAQNAASKDEFDALPLFVHRVTRKPPSGQATKTAETLSSKESKESVKTWPFLVEIWDMALEDTPIR